MGTWKIPLTHWKNPGGATVWDPGDGGGGVVGFVPASGTLQGEFAPDNAAIYLDGASTPSDLFALPPGWTPDTNYALHWLSNLGNADDNISINVPAIVEIINRSGPDGVGPPPLTISPFTGCTLLTLIGIGGSTITVTMTVGSTGVAVVGNETGFAPDTQVWFEGTYGILAYSWWKKEDGAGTHYKWAQTQPLGYAATDDVPVPEVEAALGEDPNNLGEYTFNPGQGPSTGGTNVRIAGTGFAEDAEVHFRGVLADDIVVVSSTLIECVSPPNVPGAHHVIVTNPDGVSG